MAQRGQMTQAINDKAFELLGTYITQGELRLMPYVQYCVLNDQNIDPKRINQTEREMLSKWRERGWIEGGAADLAISKAFYDAICQLLWLGYVDYEAQVVAG